MIALGALAVWGAQAQDTDEYGRALHVKCHTNEMQDLLFEAHPEIKETAAHYARVLKEFAQNFQETGVDRDEPYIIPVVFHVVHNFGPENISNAQVEDCIRVMNEDFSATNAGAALVNTAFADIVADVGIEFRLALIDPDGNCTNGVVRTVNHLTNAGGEILKVISPIWDRSKYMNVWVCGTIASGSAGYTYYPSSLAGAFGLTNDGIVVRSDYVGAIGTSSNQRSHTMTHEVGHWINLPHLWGNSNQPLLEENCEIDDGVEDTPNTVGWTGCNINGESCGSLDNVENYMEYAFCSKMFTEGQKNRMLASLNANVASRSNLWQPQNLEDTGVMLEAAPCKAEFSASTRTICVGESIDFLDESFSNITSRNWIFQGGIPATSSALNPSVTFNQAGEYAVSIAVTDGSTQLTDVKSDFIRVLDSANNALPFEEGFENYFTFGLNEGETWFTAGSVAADDWKITDQASASGSRSTFVRGFVSPNQSNARLESETFDLSSVQGPVAVTFKYAHANVSEESNDRLRVWAKRDCDSPWSVRKIIEGDALPTVDYFVDIEFVPSEASEWKEVAITNLISSFYTTEFRLMFEFFSENGNNLYIDDINIIDLAGSALSVNEEMTGFRDLAVWPNPSKGQLQFSMVNQGGEGQIIIDLFDVSGRKLVQLFKGNAVAGKQVIDAQLNGLGAGVYLARISTTNGGQKTLRIVIQP
jgi:PKD repeat protein